MLPTLKEFCDLYGLRHRAVDYRLKKLGYTCTRSDGKGVGLNKKGLEETEYFKLKDVDFYRLINGQQIYTKRSVVTVKPAGEDLIRKLCSDQLKPLEQESKSA